MTAKSGQIILALLLLTSTGSAQAADDFTTGTTLYSKSDFAGAIVSLNKFTASHPTSAQGYYMLGNCYVQIRDFANAKRCYALAIANKPDAIVRDHSLKAIENISMHTAPRAQQPRKTARPTGSSTSANEPETPPEVTASTKADEEIERIMKDATKRADRVREEQKAALERYKEGHSQWFKRFNGETYERWFGIKPEWEQEVLAPFDVEIQKIMDDAEHRCDGVRKSVR